MRKVGRIPLLLVLVAYLGMQAFAATLEVGAKFDLTRIAGEKKTAGTTIVAFMPSLTYDCEYASMLTQSFYYYFDRGLAFEDLKRMPPVNVILVVKDVANERKSTQNLIGGMKVVYDEKGELFSHFGVDLPDGKNANSTVVLVHSNDQIAFVDTAYRAQGEHLKPLENKLRQLNGIDPVKKPNRSVKELKIGDRAPDFEINAGRNLSDLRGEVVLISFYPAAFSGKFPRPLDAEVKQEAVQLFNTKYKFEPGSSLNTSCIAQISGIEFKAADHPKTAKRIVVSSSTLSLLNKWRAALKTENVIYANDPDYTVSKLYRSFNPAGYNNRVSVIVDRNGRIAYIDASFDPGDEAVLESKIEELVKK